MKKNRCKECNTLIYGKYLCRECYNEQNTKLINYCIDCKKEINRYAKRCKKCFYKNKEKYPRNNKCVDCGKDIYKKATRCMPCSKKGILNLNYKSFLKTKYPRSWVNTNIREFIRNRDNNKCYICGKSTKENKRKLSVHHIDYNTYNLKEENLVSLCNSCHTKTNYNRDYWINFFQPLFK